MSAISRQDLLTRLDSMYDRADSEQAAYEAGYLAGLANGISAERRDRDRIDAEWQSWLGVAKSSLDLPTHAQLERSRTIDHQPCAARCKKCSRCIHSLAYWARGGRDYLGVGAETQILTNSLLEAS
jgi:hypothetical protein